MHHLQVRNTSAGYMQNSARLLRSEIWVIIYTIELGLVKLHKVLFVFFFLQNKCASLPLSDKHISDRDV